MLNRLCWIFGLAASVATAEPLRVAAAANLSPVMPALVAAFHEAHPHITVETSFGASGSLVAQIRHGAPYDVFLSADLDYPRALITAGQADEKSLVVFAIGQLVLWSRQENLDLSDLAAALRAPTVGKIAIAHPDTAPYGRAAKETLEQLGLWALLRPKLVVAENISQTVQFVDSGNADLGFVTFSALKTPALTGRGSWQIIPAALYLPLMQGGVITQRGAGQPSAQRFMEFLRSDSARNIFARFGYGMPASP